MKKLITLCFALIVLLGQYSVAQAQSTCPTYKLFLPLVQNNYNPYPGPNMPILSGVQRTPSQILSNLPPPITQPWEEKYFITSVDYIAHTMMLSIRGSAAQWIPVLPSIASTMGTLQAPNVVPQNWARVQRIKNRYWVVGWDKDPNSFGAGVVGSTLPAPLNWNIYQRGAQLDAFWSAVPGAIAYEVWQNTSASPTGAVLAPGGRVGNALGWNYQLGTSSSNLITVNCDFEQGGFNGWTILAGVVGSETVTIETTIVHGGSYATHIRVPIATGSIGNAPGKGIVTNQGSALFSGLGIPVTASTLYTATAFLNITAIDAHETFIMRINWFNSSGNFITTDNAYTRNTTTGGYIQISGNVISPGTAAYAAITLLLAGDYFNPTTSVISDTYIDDVALVGLQTVNPNTLFYAPRALGTFSGQVSPFSSWQQPVQQSLAIGIPTSPHTQLSPTAAGNISSLLSPGIGVAQTPKGFTDTGWNIPLISAANPVSETWVYVSATQFKIVGLDSTLRYTAGTKVRFKNNGSGSYLYGRVTSSSFSTDTTVTIVGDAVPNATITDNYYSYELSPSGYNKDDISIGVSAARIFSYLTFR